jgi:hypothetical protein
MVTVRDILPKKIGSGMHSDLNSIRELVVSMPGKKVLEHHSGLHPSEKELLKWHSRTAFCHKNTPG